MTTIHIDEKKGYHYNDSILNRHIHAVRPHRLGTGGRKSLTSMILAAIATETNIKPSTKFSLSVDDKTGTLVLHISRKIDSQRDGKLIEKSGEVPGEAEDQEKGDSIEVAKAA